MEDPKFSIKSTIRHAKAFACDTLRMHMYKTGQSVSRIMSLLVIMCTILCTLPLFITIIFVVLGFAFAEWIPTIGYGLSFLISAGIMLLLIILFILIALLLLRKPKEKMFRTIMDIDNKLFNEKDDAEETSSYNAKSLTAPTSPEEIES